METAENISKKQSKQVTIEGPGLHTGSNGKVTFTRIEAEETCCTFNGSPFVFPVGSSSTFSFSAENGTIIHYPDSLSLYTPEHLLGTLCGFSRLGLMVQIEGREVPGMDGSGRNFLECIDRLISFGASKPIVTFKIYESSLQKEYFFSDGYLKTSPFQGFSVTYIHEQNGMNQHFVFDTDSNTSVEDYLEKIIPSKTFINYKSFEFCRKKGLLRGVTPQSGMLLFDHPDEFKDFCQKNPRKTGTLVPYQGRFLFQGQDSELCPSEYEFALHKILDLLGDLAINGLSLPSLKIVAKNSGHFHNHLLLKDIINERNNTSH
ncbi:MAG: UDP-3-O-acyl-N-acetylglucosamine deacetylase [Fibrobacteria bacterium]|nr:UDP-3-O-acyl-N-acetylglucosamine deacetylase [Fibrobacteria bacterium]